MPLHIISSVKIPDKGKTQFIANRLVLSAGASTDAIAQDLRTNFQTPAAVTQLFSITVPLRGLPSAGENITIPECQFCACLPQTALDYNSLIAIADDILAVSIHVFDGTEWLRVRDANNVVKIKDAKLFRLLP